jgi:hypothetical protein
MSDPNNLEGPPPTPEERAAMARELDQVAPTPADKFALMFNNRPTPRTDKAEYQVRLGRYRRMVVYPDFARKLERELAEARELVAMYKEAKEELSQYSERRNIEKQLAAAMRERDNAESDRKQAEADTIRALHERNEARGQRDRLAACLDHLREKDWFREGVTGREVVCGLDPDKVREALAELEGGAR